MFGYTRKKKPTKMADHYKSDRVYDGIRKMDAAEKKLHREQMKRALANRKKQYACA